jgi:hypothetical protein
MVPNRFFPMHRYFPAIRSSTFRRVNLNYRKEEDNTFQSIKMNKHTLDYPHQVILNLHFQLSVYSFRESYTMLLLEPVLHIFDKLNELSNNVKQYLMILID